MQEKIIAILAKYKEDERIKASVLDDSFKNESDYSTFDLCGGLNGSGNWSDYFKALSEICDDLLNEFTDVWVINVVNDCADDIFYCTIGIR